MFSVPEQFHTSRIRQRVLNPTCLLDAVAAKIGIQYYQGPNERGPSESRCRAEQRIAQGFVEETRCSRRSLTGLGRHAGPNQAQNESADARKGLGSSAGGQQIIVLPETCSEEGNYGVARGAQ